MSELELFGNRVLVDLELAPVEGVSAGGIILPGGNPPEGVKKGRVRAVSPYYYAGGVKIVSEFEVGDAVLIDELGGIKVKIKGKDYVIVRNEDVVGILTE